MGKEEFNETEKRIVELLNGFEPKLLIGDKNELYGSLFVFDSPKQLKQANARLNRLLSLNDESIYAYIWNSLTGYEDHSNFSGPLKELWNRLKAYRADFFNHVNYNKTPVLTFENGTLSPMTQQESDYLTETILNESDSSPECKEFCPSLLQYDHAEKATFTIKNNKHETVGHVALAIVDSVPVYTLNTYNLEYYICPQFRKQGFASAAVKTLIKAVLNDEIILDFKDDNMQYTFITRPLDAKLINVYIKSNNIASLKTATAAGFIKQGTVLTVDSNNMICEYVNMSIIKPAKRL